MRPYWNAFMDTEEWAICFDEVERAETEDALKKALEHLFCCYDDFIEHLVEDNV